MTGTHHRHRLSIDEVMMTMRRKDVRFCNASHHGRRIHNMEATREEVIAALHAADGAAEAVADAGRAAGPETARR